MNRVLGALFDEIDKSQYSIFVDNKEATLVQNFKKITQANGMFRNKIR